MTHRPVLPFAMVLLAVVSLAACGKAGMPVPRKTQDTFTISEAGVTVLGGCLAAHGTVTGAMRNFDRVMIEVEPVQPYEDCPGCPFVAREYQEFSASAAQFDAETGRFLLSFCPVEAAPMYRWRLVGKNVHPGLPHAATTPQTVIMKE